MRYWLVMPAAGAGRRFGGGTCKQYRQLAGRTVIEWALAPFLADPRCAGACVALAADDARFSTLPVSGAARLRVVPGGAQRADSVLAGVDACGADGNDWVLVHDAARPCIEAAEIDRLLVAGASGEGALLAQPLSDTLKRADSAGRVQRTEPREQLWRALTPQMFRAGALSAALRTALAQGRVPTDEAQAMEWAGVAPLLVAGSALNIKVTVAADLALAEMVLRMRGEG